MPQARANNMDYIRRDWKERKLPDDLEGASVLDVGGWAGGWAKCALEHNAGEVLVVDACRSPKQMEDVPFRQMDFMSDTAFQLPQFDIVMLFGILYHVHDPIGMLYRARRLCKQELWLETACMPGRAEEPRLATFTDVTNWFKPNTAAIEWMFRQVGFEPEFIRLTHPGQNQDQDHTKRCVYKGKPCDARPMDPRGKGWMNH